MADANSTPPEYQLREAIRSAGIHPPERIEWDGVLHRFHSDKNRDLSGWYVAYDDGIPAGSFGCWRQGASQNWRADIGRELTSEENIAHQERMEKSRVAREADRERQQDEAKATMSVVWASATPAPPTHTYLAKKGIQPHGARVDADGRLIVPLYDSGEKLASLQYIAPNGLKLYHSGISVKGCFWILGEVIDGPICLAEGFATAATIHEATGRSCVVAFSAGNLSPVLESLRSKSGAQREIVIVADNDKSGAGERHANEAAQKYGARVVLIPIVGMDANDYVQAGHDLAALLAGEREDTNTGTQNNQTEWPTPQSLTTKVDPEPYPIDALPDTVRAAVEEVLAFVKAPIPLIASSALAAISMAAQAYIDVARANKLHGPSSLFSQKIVDAIPSYWEVSPSGRGLRAWCQGELPQGGGSKAKSRCMTWPDT